jgi:hypothetical protein
MATIQIANLSSVASELSNDSESFLNELSNEEMTDLLGLGYFYVVWAGKKYGFAWG